jgi:DNA primase
MIPASFVQELIDRTDIVGVVGRHVELKKAGINHKGLCPFHGEKTPSFIVSPSRQSYHCFGCGAHGDAIRFLMEHAGLGFVEAVRELAGQAGMVVPEDERSAAEREREREIKSRQSSLTEVLAHAAAHYRQQLKASPRAIDYLKKRGLTGAIAARFALGYAPDGWRALASVFPRYDDPLLVESGLVVLQGEDGEEQHRYDRFRDRIMFPIRDVRGRVIGFGGRVLDGGDPKYLNSPETPVFVKGRELYGLFEAHQAIRERGHVVVVEGYMDVVALAQLGIGNVVATLGTACTAEHVAKLLRFTDSIVFSFDGDAAGRRAAARALEAALPHAGDTRQIRFLFLPPEHDPDSFVRAQGPAAFEACVDDAVPLSRQLIEQAGAECNLDTAEGRARLLANARPLWSQLPDGALKRQLLADLAAAGRIEPAELRELWGGVRRATAAVAGTDSRRQIMRGSWRQPARSINRATANLLDRALWLLVHRSELWATLDAQGHDLLAGPPGTYGTLFAALERCLVEHGAMTPAALLARLREDQPDAARDAVLERVSALHDPDPDADLPRELARVVDRLRLRAIEDELALLFESGELSGEARLRESELRRLQRELKAQLSGAGATSA